MAEQHPIRILVAEDMAALARGLKVMLSHAGYEVVGPVATMQRLTASAENDAYDLALLDVNLRGEYVDAVVPIIQQRGVPVILATGYDESALPESLRDLPRITKPIDFDQLTSMIDNLCVRSDSDR